MAAVLLSHVVVAQAPFSEASLFHPRSFLHRSARHPSPPHLSPPLPSPFLRPVIVPLRPPPLPAATRLSTFVARASLPDALLFDCDGVLVDTERDGHRVSFNDTFTEKGLNVTWDVDLYGVLLKIGGGKERMTAYFNKVGWPEVAPVDEQERKDFIASLHKRKTILFMELIEKGSLPLRPGVVRLIDEAQSKGVKVAVCSTSNEKAVSAIVRVLLGSKRAESILIFAGDIVPHKKPDPAIYTLAATTLAVDPARCIVIEDSAIGVAAAKAAGMNCIVTKSGYTAEEKFDTADAVFDYIGDPPNVNIDIEYCSQLLDLKFNKVLS